MVGSGLSREDRGVLECDAKMFGATGDSNGEGALISGFMRGWSMDAFDGLSTAKVFDLKSGLGPQEKF